MKVMTNKEYSGPIETINPFVPLYDPFIHYRDTIMVPINETGISVWNDDTTTINCKCITLNSSRMLVKNANDMLILGIGDENESK